MKLDKGNGQSTPIKLSKYRLNLDLPDIDFATSC